MEIRIQSVAATPLVIEIMICAFGYFLDLRIRGYMAHNGEDLSGQHHTDMIREETFYSLSVVVIIAVEPAFFLRTFYPFPASHIFGEPGGFPAQIVGEESGRKCSLPAADIVPTPVCIFL